MPRFIDNRTGETVNVPDDSPQLIRYQQRASRYQQVDAEEPPDGTVDEVLEWAGDDPDRRTLALAAEKAGKGRKGIIDALS